MTQDTYPTVLPLTQEEISELKAAQLEQYERQQREGTSGQQRELLERIHGMNRKERRRLAAMKKAAPVSKIGLF